MLVISGKKYYFQTCLKPRFPMVLAGSFRIVLRMTQEQAQTMYVGRRKRDKQRLSRSKSGGSQAVCLMWRDRWDKALISLQKDKPTITGPRSSTASENKPTEVN